MTPITLDAITRNAYRTLGLTAAASQAQIDAAARSLRLWDDPTHIPPTPNDALFLGPIKRSRQDIESAVSRLAEPESRVEERLWWFCTLLPAATLWSEPADTAPASTRHDIGLFALYRALLAGTQSHALRMWEPLIHRFDRLASDEQFLAWLQDAEQNGDFEKRASPEELAASQKHLAERPRATLAAIGTQISLKNIPAIARIVSFLRLPGDSGATPIPQADPAARILDHLEDSLTQRCDEHREAVTAAWNTRNIETIKPACERVLAEFDTTIKPLLHGLSDLVDSHRRQRARQHCAALLVYVADAFQACRDPHATERALRRAMEFAAGTPLEPTLAQRLEKLIDANRPRIASVPFFSHDHAFTLAPQVRRRQPTAILTPVPWPRPWPLNRAYVPFFALIAIVLGAVALGFWGTLHLPDINRESPTEDPPPFAIPAVPATLPSLTQPPFTLLPDDPDIRWPKVSDLQPFLNLAPDNPALAANHPLPSELGSNASDPIRTIAPIPMDAAAYIDRAESRRSIRDYEGAIADYTRAIALLPEKPALYDDRGFTRYLNDELPAAIADCSRAIELDPRFTHAYTDRAYAKRASEDFAGALADINHAIALDPKNASLYDDRGFIRTCKDDLDAAIDDFNSALRFNPASASACSDRGLAYLYKGDRPAALADLNHAIELDPKFASAYRRRACIELASHDWSAAISDLQSRIDLDPTDVDYPQMYLWLARARLHRLDANKPLAAYFETRAKTSVWPAQIASFLLGKTTEKDLLDRAVSPDPRKQAGQRCEAFFFIGTKYFLANKTTAAADCFRQCLATQKKHYTEYDLAAAELKSLGSRDPGTKPESSP